MLIADQGHSYSALLWWNVRQTSWGNTRVGSENTLLNREWALTLPQVMASLIQAPESLASWSVPVLRNTAQSSPFFQMLLLRMWCLMTPPPRIRAPVALALTAKPHMHLMSPTQSRVSGRAWSSQERRSSPSSQEPRLGQMTGMSLRRHWQSTLEGNQERCWPSRDSRAWPLRGHCTWSSRGNSQSCRAYSSQKQESRSAQTPVASVTNTSTILCQARQDTMSFRPVYMKWPCTPKNTLHRQALRVVSSRRWSGSFSVGATSESLQESMRLSSSTALSRLALQSPREVLCRCSSSREEMQLKSGPRMAYSLSSSLAGRSSSTANQGLSISIFYLQRMTIQEDTELLRHCLLNRQNINLIKTGEQNMVTLKQLLDRTASTAVTVQCLELANKAYLLYELHYQLNHTLDLDLPPFHSLSDFLDSLPTITKLLRKRANGPFYIILADFQYLQKIDRFVESLLDLKRLSENRVSVVLVSSVPIDKLLLPAHRLVFVDILLSPDPALCQHLIRKDIQAHLNMEHFNSQERHQLLDQVLAPFVADVFAHFKDISQDSQVLLSVAHLLFLPLMQYLQQDTNDKYKFSFSLIPLCLSRKNRAYTIGKSLLLEDINKTYSSQQFLQEIQDYVRFERENQLKEEQKNLLLKGLSNYQALFLIACTIANRNPEGSDKMVFGHSNHQKQPRQGSQKVKATPLPRLLFIVNELISATNQQQRQCFDQEVKSVSNTDQFAMQLAYLEEIGFIQASREEGSLDAKYLCMLELHQVPVLAKRFNISLEYYLCKGEA